MFPRPGKRRCYRGFKRHHGFSLIEALVSIAIFLVGAVLIVYLFPQTLRAAKDAELLTKAAFLAQMKAEEIRRDDSRLRQMNALIRVSPQPTAAMTFAQEPDLSYAFSGETIIHKDETPEGDSNVSRVLIIRNYGGVPPATITARDVIYEMRFAP